MEGRAGRIGALVSGVMTWRPWRMRWRGTGRLMGLVFLLSLVALRVWDPAPLQMLRVKAFDIYQRIQPREITQRPVTIVDVDERSMNEVGQWPWPRTIIGDMVSRLTAMGAVVIGFDMVFPEPDRMSPSKMAEALPGLDGGTRDRLMGMPSNDAVLAEAIANGRVVVGMAARTTQGEDRTVDAPRTSIAMIGPDARPWLNTYSDVLRNIPILDQAAAGRGMFNVAGELDGVVRRVPMVMATQDGTIYASLSAEMLRVATGTPTIGIKTRELDGIEGIVIQRQLIRTDRNGQTYVNFSRYDREKYVPAVDILNGTAPREKIAGHMVLVGTSAVGLLDIKSSPLDSFLPGVEVHANILENVLQQTQLTRPRDADGKEVVLTVAGGLLMILLVPLVGARWAVGMLVVFVGGAIGASWIFYTKYQELYGVGYPVLSAIALYMYLTYANYAREEAQRRQVRDAFSRYMSPALVEKLAQDPDRLKLGGEMKDMTLLFCDVRGFTTISEQFSDNPTGLTRLINRFLTPMTNVILERKGTIDKYMGDCIMAFWNAPLDDEQHAANGCRSALAMLEAMTAVNDARKAEAEEEGVPFLPLNVGIGLNSGEVCVGNMGSDQRFDYSVLGDSVNLAARLEGQSKTYGVLIVIGEATRDRAPGFATLELDLIKVKGKTLPVRIFTLVGDETLAASREFQALKEEHDGMLAAYRLQAWGEAREHLERCRPLVGALPISGLYDLYEDRLDAYQQDPPGQDWDGVFTALTK